MPDMNNVEVMMFNTLNKEDQFANLWKGFHIYLILLHVCVLPRSRIKSLIVSVEKFYLCESVRINRLK